MDTHSVDEIGDLINNSEDNGIIQLDEEYDLESNKTLKINKSITINGVENKTIIDGNGNYLFLDTPEKEKIISKNGAILLPLDYGELKNNGKHIIFNNITFKNIKIKTWHDMEFNNCNFINSTFTSKELNNKFNNCIFNNSTIELIVLIGYNTKEISRVYSEFLNCKFIESELKTKREYSSFYRHRVGSDFFELYDSINIGNCSFSKSKISINNLYINMTQSSFNQTNIKGHSNSINIKDSEFNNQNTDFTICKTSFTNSTFNNSNINLEASYFSIGTSTNFKHCPLNNSKIKLTPGFRSRKSQITLFNSTVENSYIDSTYAVVIIENSTLNQTGMLLFFSGLKINNSEIYYNDALEGAIKTKLQEEKEVMVDESLKTVTVNYQVKTDYQINNSHFTNESGKCELNAGDISKNTLYNLTYIKQDYYYVNNQIIFELKDRNGKPVAGEEIFIDVKDKYELITPSIITDENGIATYRLTEIGNFTIRAYYYSPGFDFDRIINSIDFDIKVNPIVDDLKVYKCNFKANTYSNIGSCLKLKITSKTLQNLSNVKLTVKLTGKNTNKIYRIHTDRDGKANFNIPAKLNAGTYKIKISVENSNITKTANIKINKAKTIVKAPKVTNKFKKSGYFKVTLKNKISKKVISNVKVKIKVYTGKKFKIYTVKTNKNGIANINTKNLKVGNHKVVISSGNSNYQISAKSIIKIEK